MKWFEELGFFENPIRSNSFKEDFELIGFEKEIKDLLYNIIASNIVILQGQPGSGKTKLLKQVINSFRGAGKLIYVDTNKLSKRLDLAKLLKKKYGFLRGLVSKYPRNMILLLDNVNNLSVKNCELLKFFYDQNYIKSAVLSTSDYKNSNISESLRKRIGNRIIKIPDTDYKSAEIILKSRFPEYVEYIKETSLKNLFKKSNNIKQFLELVDSYLEEKIVNDKPLSTSKINKLLKQRTSLEKTMICNVCNEKLEEINDEWVCSNCDTYCISCGTKVFIETETCPKCQVTFEN